MVTTDASEAPLKTRQTKARVGIAIEDRWRRQGIEALLEREGFTIHTRNAEVALADAPRPWRDIRDALLRVRARFPGTALLVFVPELRYEFAEQCFVAGAMGVLHFNSEPSLILQAIDAVRRGNVWAPRSLISRAIRDLTDLPLASATGEFNFTRAERRVFRALRDELTNKEIARLLDVSEATVKIYVSRLLRKTHCANRHQLRHLSGMP